jgi:serine/threonine-protein kinase
MPDFACLVVYSLTQCNSPRYFPDNLIRRSADSLPVLIDFGGVKQLPVTPVFWFTQLGVIRTRLGKKGYAPEEQLRHGKAFPSSDLYALAVTALVLLTGQEPQALYDSYKGIWLWKGN